MSQRPVRVTLGFFDTLDSQLPADRGPNGTPSATDFIAIDLPGAIDQFAKGFDELPEWIEGVPGTRVSVTPGYLVKAMAIFGVLADDGAIDLVAISIEL